MLNADKYDPHLPKNPHKRMRDKVMADPEARAEYESFKAQLELAIALRKQREKAHLSQEQVADSMETTKSVVSRLESSQGKHSPSLNTLVKYASALGCEIKFTLVPIRKTKGKKDKGRKSA